MILYSPKVKNKVVDDENKEAFDEEVMKLNTTKLKLISKPRMTRHLLNNKDNDVLSDQWETTLDAQDSDKYEEVRNNDFNYLYGSGQNNPLIHSKITDPEENLAQISKTRLGGIPIAETIEAGPSSAFIGTDACGTISPRTSNRKSGNIEKIKISQKPPPIENEVAKGVKSRSENIRAFFEKEGNLEERMMKREKIAPKYPIIEGGA